ncbi:phenoloxidase-activating factor 3-like [Wyeomyia smithii]|uniref:phenoloxidase-activating factor 3-like n=1 Tax=Wyeomyia smithii TaxID=174621 RepID=UPI002467B419|nr:phenoloxidase-activating factor 3-like [Wyeomyia smithii]XP_055545333.1 phenoloxidase-activating factor 3-like [Wyeomyia smithii]
MLLLKKLMLVALLFVNSTFGNRRCVGQKQCTEFGDCPEFKHLVGVPLSSLHADVRAKLKNNHCKTEKRGNVNIYSVCCSTNPPLFDRSKALAMLNMATCGRTTEDKISFGRTAKVFQYPWMALLLNDERDVKCGGTLIAESYVLTAAHCDRDVALVRLGENNISKPIDCNDLEDCADPPQDIQISKFIKHPLYSASKKKNDIAIIKLAKPAILSSSVKTICLPIDPLHRHPLPKSMIVSGWGNTENGSTSDVLQFASLSLFPTERCARIISRMNDAIKLSDESQFCAGGRNKIDNCSGDSGGPLQSLSWQSVAVQYGIVSFGINSCGVQNAPGVYTNVSFYTEWILLNLK